MVSARIPKGERHL